MMMVASILRCVCVKGGRIVRQQQVGWQRCTRCTPAHRSLYACWYCIKAHRTISYLPVVPFATWWLVHDLCTVNCCCCWCGEGSGKESGTEYRCKMTVRYYAVRVCCGAAMEYRVLRERNMPFSSLAGGNLVML